MSRYRIIPERSTLWAEARSSLHPIRVETNGLEGFVVAEPQAAAEEPLTGSVELDSARLKTGSVLYDRELERRLEMRRYPRVRGEALKSRREGPNRYHLRGSLSFHGVTRSLEGEVSLRVVSGDTIEIEGSTVIDVRDFNLQPPSFLMLRVYPEVRVRVRILAQVPA